MQDPIFLSVIIPTIRGREKYLGSSIQTCLKQNTVIPYEIIVSDNGGDCQNLVSSFNDVKLRYIRPASYMSMPSHWDFALSEAKGEYICIIGDDDGLMPNAVERVWELAKQFPGLPIHNSLANFYWPDCSEVAKARTIDILRSIGTSNEIVHSTDFLERSIQGNNQYLDGPMIYHNFIPRQTIEDAKIAGLMFHRSAPDVFSSFSIAHACHLFLTTHEILTLAGTGAKSNGAAAARLSDISKAFNKEAEDQFPSRFRGRSFSLMELDCLMEAQNLHTGSINDEDYHYEKFLYRSVHELAKYRSPPLFGLEALALIRNSIKLRKFQSLLVYLSRKITGRIWRLLSGQTGVANASGPEPDIRLNLLRSGVRLNLPDNINNILDAVDFLDSRVKEVESKS